MNTRAEIALDTFVEDFEAFLEKCEITQASGVWNTEENGLMSAYFESDLFAVVLQVMSADGVFEGAEAEVVSRMFSTNYTPRQLCDIYRQLETSISDYVEEEAEDAVHTLAEIDPALAEDYRSLILTACKVVSQADGVAEGEERRIIREVEAALDGWSIDG